MQMIKLVSEAKAFIIGLLMLILKHLKRALYKVMK